MSSVTLQSAGVVGYRERVGKTHSVSGDPSIWRAHSCCLELPGDGGAVETGAAAHT